MKIFPLIALLFSLTAKAQTSVYHPFPESNAHWNWSAIVPPCGMDINYMKYSFVMEGDTTIGGYSYHKLMTPGYTVYSAGTICPFFRWLGYQGGIRQDTSAKKVYYLFPGNTVAELLYDFNLQVGDTVYGTLSDSGWCPTVVTAIDSVQCSSGWRKRWQYTADMSTYVIEGIGAIDGMLEANCIILGQPEISLSCFSENGQPIYPANATSCDIIDAVKNIPDKNPVLTISPNPFHASFLLQVSPAFEKAMLTILNFQGAIVREDKIQNQPTVVFQRNELPNGIYFVHLMNDSGQVMSAKVVAE